MYTTSDSSYTESFDYLSPEIVVGILAVAIAVSLLFAIICAVIASVKRRSGVAWFFIGLITGILGLIIICCLGRADSCDTVLIADEIEKLSALRQKGIISQREFEKRKKELLRK